MLETTKRRVMCGYRAQEIGMVGKKVIEDTSRRDNEKTEQTTWFCFWLLGFFIIFSACRSNLDHTEQKNMTEVHAPGSILANASEFTVNNSQFQTAEVINNYHSGNNNNVSAIRNWLKAPDPSTNFVAACDKKTDGTGDWILSHSEYVKWHQGKHGILWIQGKVGSGKTILSTTIIKSLQAELPLGSYYYYFDNRDNSKTKTTARGLLQSLLLQMATRSEGVHPTLHALYMKCNEGVMEPTTEDLSSALAAVVKDLSPVFLVLDAMDECSEAVDVFRHLAHVKDNLCIAITSRYLAETSYDVSWISLHIGQFRWVDCQVTVLQRCKTPKAIRDALKKLPKSLEETYTVAIKRISESEHVTEILAVDLDKQIFDCEARSLELETGVYDILDSTLIVVNVNSVVQLAHNSVKEFLVSSQGQPRGVELIEINEQLADSIICETCLIYLLELNSEEIYEFEKDYPLSIYAAKYWPAHMRMQGKEALRHQRAHDLAVTLIKKRREEPYINWIRIHGPERDWRAKCNPILMVDKIHSPLYYMAYEGLARIIEDLLSEETTDVNAQGGKYGNALQAAAAQGNKDVVQLLLEHKADANAQGGHYGNALQAAAAQNNKDIVHLLLEHKSDVNGQGGHYGNALQAAATGGNKDIVQLLLEHKANANAQGGEYGNALQAAVAQGNKDIVQLLLEHKADANAQGDAYRNALYVAAAQGNKDIVQVLLEHKADANAHGNALYAAATDGNKDIMPMPKGDTMGNALYAAAAQNNKDIVLLLLEHNADANAKGGEYGNALQAAVAQGNKDIVQLLLEHKADANAQGDVLLEHKADANTQGGHYGNALQAAAAQGNKDVVQLLLEHKQMPMPKVDTMLLLEHTADANAQDPSYGNALYVATAQGNKDIVQILLEHKANVNAQGGYFGNALQAAAARGSKDILQLLLEHMADVNGQGGHYGNALQAATTHGDRDVVDLLLEHKADVNGQGGYYGNALYAAAAEGKMDISKVLLEHKADPNAQGRLYGNALQAAAAEGNKDIVQLLLEHKADVNGQGGEYGNALQAAVAQGNKDIVRLLLGYEADANVQGGHYGTALQAAVAQGDKYIVQLLLEHKGEANTQDGKYENALYQAAAKGNKDTVQL
ncbi:ankyrin repeat-containing domain protein [Rhodocollybia butyracea]|uniref:Ankyrin repeat-containing domain protein n=1 Tax=Rhodocollybia butyracea TaxID=206335 RepID=A0A9P5PLV6_9AGAR|nr:ankyrin repeat-containing domain protein [Rhodocollybia butyracea]